MHGQPRVDSNFKYSLINSHVLTGGIAHFLPSQSTPSFRKGRKRSKLTGMTRQRKRAPPRTAITDQDLQEGCHRIIHCRRKGPAACLSRVKSHMAERTDENPRLGADFSSIEDTLARIPFSSRVCSANQWEALISTHRLCVAATHSEGEGPGSPTFLCSCISRVFVTHFVSSNFAFSRISPCNKRKRSEQGQPFIPVPLSLQYSRPICLLVTRKRALLIGAASVQEFGS